MEKSSKDEKIKNLEHMLAMCEENCEWLAKLNSELVNVEKDNFMHSPIYLQMKEKISFLEIINISNDIHIASLKKNAFIMEDDVKQVYEDNKKLISEKADAEYFIGITENWHDAQEYKKLKEEIYELKGKIEQKDLAIQDRNMEIEKLQERLTQIEARTIL